jgi:Pentapeptide repeats (8 copies)
MNTSLIGANLSGAVLTKACLRESALKKAILADADISHADLSWTNLGKANLARARLEGADLTGANLVETNISGANFRGCYVFGASVWNVIGDPIDQSDLIITNERESPITVDDLRVAQFLYLMLSNDKLRATIDAVSRKIVLILGRFLPARKIVLNAIREALRTKGYIPILFDFSKPAGKTFIETVSIFAHLSRFVIADFSDGKVIYHEVPHIVQTIAVPIKPILSSDVEESDPVTLLDLRVGSSKVLDTLRYRSVEHLLEVFVAEVVQPAEERATQLQKEKSF